MDPDSDDRSADLIQRIVDGEATPVERAELDALLVSSAPTRAEYEALSGLVRRLDNYPMAESPHLKDEILAKLRARTVVVPFPARRRRAVFGLAWAAAAAVIVGIALDQWRSRATVDPGSAGATMSQPVEDRRPRLSGQAGRLSSTGEAFADWRVVARQTTDRTTLTVRKSGDDYAVTVEEVLPGTSLTWEPEQLTFLRDPAGSGYDVANKKSGVVTFSAPADRGTVFLRRVDDARGPVSVFVSQSGQEILKKSIPFE